MEGGGDVGGGEWREERGGGGLLVGVMMNLFTRQIANEEVGVR
jgi:hypothetical protein